MACSLPMQCWQPCLQRHVAGASGTTRGPARGAGTVDTVCRLSPVTQAPARKHALPAARRKAAEAARPVHAQTAAAVNWLCPALAVCSLALTYITLSRLQARIEHPPHALLRAVVRKMLLRSYQPLAGDAAAAAAARRSASIVVIQSLEPAYQQLCGL